MAGALVLGRAAIELFAFEVGPGRAFMLAVFGEAGGPGGRTQASPLPHPPALGAPQSSRASKLGGTTGASELAQLPPFGLAWALADCALPAKAKQPFAATSTVNVEALQSPAAKLNVALQIALFAGAQTQPHGSGAASKSSPAVVSACQPA